MDTVRHGAGVGAVAGCAGYSVQVHLVAVGVVGNVTQQCQLGGVQEVCGGPKVAERAGRTVDAGRERVVRVRQPD